MPSLCPSLGFPGNKGKPVIFRVESTRMPQPFPPINESPLVCYPRLEIRRPRAPKPKIASKHTNIPTSSAIFIFIAASGVCCSPLKKPSKPAKQPIIANQKTTFNILSVISVFLVIINCNYPPDSGVAEPVLPKNS